MNSMNNGRRKFLGNFALLSAGIVFGGPSSLALGMNNNMGLEDKWVSFSKKLGGKTFYGSIPKETEHYLPACKGHRQKLGTPVIYGDTEVVAVPVWIYWDNSTNPADMVLTFIGIHGYKPLGRLNRFELDALQSLEMNESDQADFFHLLKRKKLFNTKFAVTAIINRRGSELKTTSSFNGSAKSQQSFININS